MANLEVPEESKVVKKGRKISFVVTKTHENVRGYRYSKKNSSITVLTFFWGRGVGHETLFFSTELFSKDYIVLC